MEIPMVNLHNINLFHLEKEKIADNAWEEIGRQLIKALSVNGFVYLKSHGIQKQLLSRVFKSSKEFFSLHKNEKMQFSLDKEMFHGYIGSFQEILDSKNDDDAFECRESFNVAIADGKSLPLDETVADFSSSLLDIFHQLDELTSRIFIALAFGMDLNPDFFTKMYQKPLTADNFSTLRTLFYPAVNRKTNETRLGEHTDYGPLTLLFQDKSIQGLEVLCPNSNRWMHVVPREDCLLLNTGDILEIMTSGHLPAALHRVKMSGNTERQSLVYFAHFDHQIDINPLPNLQPHSSKMKQIYSKTTSFEYVQNRLNKTHQES